MTYFIFSSISEELNVDCMNYIAVDYVSGK